MNLPLTILASVASFGVAFIAWYMAGRRTLYVQRLERKQACRLVWWEELFPFIGFGGFLLVPTPLEKAVVALSAATGGMIGLWVAMTVEIGRRKVDQTTDDTMSKEYNKAGTP